MIGFFAQAQGQHSGSSGGGSGRSGGTDDTPELISYTCKLSVEEQQRTANPADLRVVLARTLHPASEHVRSYVSEYVTREGIVGIVTLEARNSNTLEWTEPSEAMVTTCSPKNLMKADQEERYIRTSGIVDPAVVETIPALEYRIAVKNGLDLIFAIHVSVTLERTKHTEITRQITAAVYNDGRLDSSWNSSMYQFFSSNNPQSVQELQATPPQVYSADLLLLCDNGVVRSVVRLVIGSSRKRQLELNVDVNRPGFVFGSKRDLHITSIIGELRTSITDPFFMKADERILHEGHWVSKAKKTIDTVSKFIAWAKSMDLKSNNWENPVKLTPRNPTLLTTATLIRVLTMLDDFSFTPQN